MAVYEDGFLDWAERVPGDPMKVSYGRNPVKGFVAHSAEGWEAYLRGYNTNHAAYASRGASWTFSNLLDGRLLQHYSIHARVWASGARFPNDNFVPMEHEGLAGQMLTPAQVRTTARVIGELATVGGWKPERGVTLWEHREMTRWGAEPTACPSGRIPWDDVLKLLQPAPVQQEEQGGRDMAIVSLPGKGSYLLIGTQIHLIPSTEAYQDMHAVIYGEGPHELKQSTWEWLDSVGVKRLS